MRKNNHNKSIALLDKVAKPLREKSIFWHHLWINCGKPKQGYVFSIMKSTRLKYHHAVKNLKRNKINSRKHFFAESIIKHDNRKCWDEVKKSKPASIDGESNPKDICDIFRQKYEMMYASSPTDKCSMDLIEGKLESLIGSAEISQEVKIKYIEKAFWKLNKNKDDGKYETNSNHFVYASARFMCIFSLLFTDIVQKN